MQGHGVRSVQCCCCFVTVQQDTQLASASAMESLPSCFPRIYLWPWITPVVVDERVAKAERSEGRPLQVLLPSVPSSLPPCTGSHAKGTQLLAANVSETFSTSAEVRWSASPTPECGESFLPRRPSDPSLVIDARSVGVGLCSEIQAPA